MICFAGFVVTLDRFHMLETGQKICVVLFVVTSELNFTTVPYKCQ